MWEAVLDPGVTELGEGGVDHRFEEAVAGPGGFQHCRRRSGENVAAGVATPGHSSDRRSSDIDEVSACMAACDIITVMDARSSPLFRVASELSIAKTE